MKSEKRKPRKKIDMSKVDIFSADVIEDITAFGSENDPCFGKLYDITTKECKRCGDAEFCCLATAQRNHLLRKKQGSNFKDMQEESSIKEGQDKVAKKARSLKKKYPDNPVKIINKLVKIFGITKKEARKFV